MAADISDRMFVILFFPALFISLGIFFAGVGFLWWVALKRRAMKKEDRG